MTYFAIVHCYHSGSRIRHVVRIMNHRLDRVLGKECNHTFYNFLADSNCPVTTENNKLPLNLIISLGLKDLPAVHGKYSSYPL